MLQPETDAVPVKLLNPYRDATGLWVRGNFHGHCQENSPCASVPLAQAAGKYRDNGYGFVTFTDHDAVTDLRAVETAHPGLIFLRGFEYSRAENLLFIGTAVPPLYLLPLRDAMAAAGGLLTIVCHPQPRPDEVYWSREKILALGRLPDGLEAYNGHYGVLGKLKAGCSPQYTHFWDSLLTAGLRMWGFANDDSHDPADFLNAWNMVLVERVTAPEIIAAARLGRCYGTTGLLLDRFDEADGRIQVAVQSPCTGRFIGPGGRVLYQADGLRFEYSVTGEAYVRFEASSGPARLFLQPLFRQQT